MNIAAKIQILRVIAVLLQFPAALRQTGVAPLYHFTFFTLPWLLSTA